MFRELSVANDSLQHGYNSFVRFDSLQHNANRMKTWRSLNKEHVAAWKTKNFVYRLNAIKQQAQVKGIVWKDDLTDEICYKMMSSACFYCQEISDHTLNGIDRLDNQGCYEVSNTAGCCKTCNFTKGCLDPCTFVKRSQHISCHFGGRGCYYPDAWSDSTSASYTEYLRRSSAKNLEFTLSKTQFEEITSARCHYCDKQNSDSHTNGVDRIDNRIGYLLGNCVTCCGECNYMKGVLSDRDFVEKCMRVANHTLDNQEAFSDHEGRWLTCKRAVCRRNNKEVISKTSIIVSRQQPPMTQQQRPKAAPYVPAERVYKKGSNLPEGCRVNAADIPKYCYYVPQTATKGDAFVCGRIHPKHTESKKDWCTTKARRVSTEENLLAYIAS